MGPQNGKWLKRASFISLDPQLSWSGTDGEEGGHRGVAWPLKIEVDALGFITISRGCFERCGSNKKTPP